MITLRELKINNSGVITKINTTGPLKQRLLDMGITKGTRITVLKIAPLGDPIECVLRGYNLSVRKNDAETIEIDENSIVVEQLEEVKPKSEEKKEKKSFFKKNKEDK